MWRGLIPPPNRFKMRLKKSIMGPIISVFVLILIVSILAGLTFLFVSSLKTNVVTTTATTSASAVNESGYINQSGYTLTQSTRLEFNSPAIVTIINGTSGTVIASGNYTLTGNVLKNASAQIWNPANITYTYKYIGEPTAYNSVNSTESAGYTVISYLPLIFLAIIFGALLTLVLRIILPYINLGQTMGSF